jgi:tetratricopeptide (TPR) repeat protein
MEVARQITGQAEVVLKVAPNDLLALYRLAFARHFTGDLAGAAREFERIVVAEPKNDWAYGYLGQAYANLGQNDRAIATWERGVAINSNNAVIHYLLGWAYAKKDDKRKAASHFAAAYRDRTLYDYVLNGSRP